jgi:hypothetical protein
MQDEFKGVSRVSLEVSDALLSHVIEGAINSLNNPEKGLSGLKRKMQGLQLLQCCS